MSSNADLIEENRDLLESVANTDSSISWIGRELLSSIDEYPSEDPQVEQTEIQANSEANTDATEPKDSLFAY